MHLGSTDRVGEEGKWRIRKEEDNVDDDDETKRLVMSLRGCLLDRFLLIILIWVFSLSMMDEEESRGLTEVVVISEGETFSLLSF